MSYYENGRMEESYTFKKGIIDGPHNQYYENGKFKAEYSYVDGFKHGEAKEYYDNGKIQSILSFVNGSLHGKLIKYHENESLEAEQLYSQGELMEWKEYNEKGQLRSLDDKVSGQIRKYNDIGQITYRGGYSIDGSVILGDGLYVSYYDDGKIRVIYSIVDGKPHGFCCEYYENGNLKEQQVFTNGELIYTRFYHSDGDEYYP